jgi:hypothetical protein
MANVGTNSSTIARALNLGIYKMQVVDINIPSGATSGTVTADGMAEMNHIIMPQACTHTAAPTFSGNVATIACTVPAGTQAAVTLGGVTYTAVAVDATGNSITVAYTAGGTAGAEVVTVVGNAISVQIESGVSTITQVRTAVNLSAAAAALVTATGTSGTAVTTATATALTGGITRGAVGPAICFGRV